MDANNIAIWDGSNWSTFGTGCTGHMARVRALAVYNGDLIVAGDFEQIDGNPISTIARWDGAIWHSMGSFSNSIRCLLTYGDDLIAGGTFQAIDNQPRWYIAKWDDSSWSALGEYGLNGMVFCLEEYQGDLIAGGTFRVAYNVAGTREEYIMVEHIARWNGVSWHALGSGLNDDVWGLGVDTDLLFVGGTFTGTLLGEELSHVATWDGHSWLRSGDGVDGRAYAFEKFGGEMYVAGQITGYYGVPFNNIARLDNGEWLPLGTGIVGNRVYDLITFQNNLYVGGWFEYAGGKPSRNIARWDWDPQTGIASVPVPAVRVTLSSFPNPFNPNTAIRFSLSDPCNIRLGIYDVAGQLVRMISNEHYSAGSWDAAWDGADSFGNELPSGIYLCRIEAGGAVKQHKLTLLK
ncbi:MAG: T9SS type A sorting domain-containing protein [bacterium]|nr:T9SS type A sorting domain-containing protein [bacterium]